MSLTVHKNMNGLPVDVLLAGTGEDIRDKDEDGLRIGGIAVVLNVRTHLRDAASTGKQKAGVEGAGVTLE